MKDFRHLRNYERPHLATQDDLENFPSDDSEDEAPIGLSAPAQAPTRPVVQTAIQPSAIVSVTMSVPCAMAVIPAISVMTPRSLPTMQPKPGVPTTGQAASISLPAPRPHSPGLGRNRAGAEMSQGMILPVITKPLSVPVMVMPQPPPLASPPKMTESTTMPEVMDVTRISDVTGHDTTLIADATNVTVGGESAAVDNLLKDLMHMATLSTINAGITQTESTLLASGTFENSLLAPTNLQPIATSTTNRQSIQPPGYMSDAQMD